MTQSYVVLLFILSAILISVLSRKIDVSGGVLGGLITYGLYATIGLLGIILIGGFFVLGTLASLWKLEQKQHLRVAEARNVRRGWRNVAANAGVAGLVAVAVWLRWVTYEMGQILIAASFAAALSDTWSSEFGNVYGSRFYHVLTGRPDERGRDGVVSAEGSLVGILGSAVMTLVYVLFRGFDSNAVVICFAGMLGNLTDSVLGATLERRGKLGNHGVNFLNTAVAAVFAYFLVRC